MTDFRTLLLPPNTSDRPKDRLKAYATLHNLFGHRGMKLSTPPYLRAIHLSIRTGDYGWLFLARNNHVQRRSDRSGWLTAEKVRGLTST
jgi:hypothetical protein